MGKQISKPTILVQYTRLLRAGIKCKESTDNLIKAAQIINPEIKTREEALALAKKIAENQFNATT